jgi:hypothetical protein
LLLLVAAPAMARPNRTASFWACTNERGVQAHVDWNDLHADSLDGVRWTDPTAPVVDPVGRPLDWKFGGTQYEYLWVDLGAVDATGVDAGLTFAARLFSRGKFLTETNGVAVADMPVC